ncbi:DUF3422 family protein [Cupriavidus alkaliphilus]|uniref:DUF3422 family protein n=1 Tax=Cupriavidus alkaliphilus TaxID=942866 RepID=UPI000DC35465|nr:DUF3422 domain-containing protein [Cupriavidus alkaliphilus]RAS03145.1 putative membrane-anchored protein [Cupriavidus alkaliphilus]
MPHLILDHPLRDSLARELHARPFLRIGGSASLTHFAIYAEGEGDTNIHHALLADLCRLTGLDQPADGATHYSARWTHGTQLKWERHTEFSTFTFVARRSDTDYFSELATSHIPAQWFERFAGKRLVALRMELVSGEAASHARDNVRQWIDGPILAGSHVLSGGEVFCDWTIPPDGFTRFLVIDNGFREVQGGRLLQRLYEIETYRMMALLSLPVARELGRSVDHLQSALAPLMRSMDTSQGGRHDAAVLERLTHLAVRIEALAESGNRFSASRAYEKLVLARIQELREERIEGIPTIAEYMERRFAPAMETCRSVWARHEQFASRVARALDLLRTRVNLAQEQDTTRLLEGMDQTARNQLRLQHAVEGLSVAAISYYVLSLAGTGLKALHAVHLPLDPDLIKGVLILPVVLLVLRATRRSKHAGEKAATRRQAENQAA